MNFETMLVIFLLGVVFGGAVGWLSCEKNTAKSFFKKFESGNIIVDESDISSGPNSYQTLTKPIDDIVRKPYAVFKIVHTRNKYDAQK